MLQVGSTFASDYQVEGVLSSGGMGSVYVVQQFSTGRRRALKLMHPDLVKDAKLRERFAQEARVASKIDSEHVVEVIAAGLEGPEQTPWLAMELLEGETLQAHLQKRGALSPAELDELFSQLCHALGAAHAVGIVHRDVKPENVFLSTTRRADVRFTVKVLDFGIAKLVADAKNLKTSAMGTPLWMAPEQTEATTVVTPATDVWALGLIAFRALTGAPYWRNAAGNVSIPAVMREVLFEPLVPASQRAAEIGGRPVPPGFDAWFGRAVSRDPNARFTNASQAFEELHKILAPGDRPAPYAPTVHGSGAFAPQRISIPQAPPPTKTARGSKAPWIIGLMVVLAALGASGWWFFIRKPPVKKPIARVEEDDEDEPRAKTSSSTSASRPTATGPWEQAAKVPVTSTDPQLGPQTAPATVVLFGDLQCPYTKKVYAFLKEQRQKHGDKLRVVWKDFPVDSHSNAKAAAGFARAIYTDKGDDAFFKVVEAFFEQQDELRTKSPDEFAKIAADKGGTTTQALYGKLPESDVIVQKTMELAKTLDVRATPVMFVNGVRIQGNDQVKLGAAIDDELAAGKDYVSRTDANYTPGPSSTTPRDPKELSPFKMVLAIGSSPTRGPSDAPVTIIDVGDFQCPPCRTMAKTIDDLAAAYPRQVRIAFKHKLLPQHERAIPSANVAFEAYKQGGAVKFWTAFQRLMDKSNESLDEPTLSRVATDLGLPASIGACKDNTCINKPTILADDREVSGQGVSGIPTLVIDGRSMSGGRTLEELKTYVDWELAKVAKFGGSPADFATECESRRAKLADLTMKDTAIGSGAFATPGKRIKVNYVGKLPDGTIFDETTGKKPFDIDLAPGKLIIGFEEALLGMRVGGKRTVTIPPDAGYGRAGRPPKIPANTNLIFELELVAVD